MKYKNLLLNLLAIVAAFLIGVIVVAVIDKLLRTTIEIPEVVGDTWVTLIAKVIGTFAGGVAIGYIAKTHQIKLAVAFGTILMVSEILLYNFLGGTNLLVYVAKVVYLAIPLLAVYVVGLAASGSGRNAG